MIERWRDAFQTPELPFFYVELCTEYGAEEPKEPDFWLAQRAALKLPATGCVPSSGAELTLRPCYAPAASQVRGGTLLYK